MLGHLQTATRAVMAKFGSSRRMALAYFFTYLRCHWCDIFYDKSVAGTLLAQFSWNIYVHEAPEPKFEIFTRPEFVRPREFFEICISTMTNVTRKRPNVLNIAGNVFLNKVLRLWSVLTSNLISSNKICFKYQAFIIQTLQQIGVIYCLSYSVKNSQLTWYLKTRCFNPAKLPSYL